MYVDLEAFLNPLAIASKPSIVTNGSVPFDFSAVDGYMDAMVPKLIKTLTAFRFAMRKTCRAELANWRDINDRRQMSVPSRSFTLGNWHQDLLTSA
jgi:hypothetical protein